MNRTDFLYFRRIGGKHFTVSHEWIEKSGSNVVTVGISHFAQVRSDFINSFFPTVGAIGRDSVL